jgi:hypothetical protein
VSRAVSAASVPHVANAPAPRQIAAGLWPERGAAAPDADGRVPAALLEVRCVRGSAPLV